VKFAWIRGTLVPEFAVRDCCRVLKVSASGYYRWLKAPVSVRTIRRRSLLAQIRAEHAGSRLNYGSPTIHERLVLSGVRVNVKTVAEIMRAAGIRSKTIRKFRPSTTQSRHGHEPAPNIIARDFSATGPDQKWLSDITYIRTAEGFLYLTCVLDAWSRSIVGWSMSDTLHSTAAIDAIGMALARRRPGAGLVFHSDRGVQFACNACRDLLRSRGVEQSMSRAGDCYDNAMMESLWATLKKELTQHETYATRADARAAVFEWIEVWYQRERSHSSLGYLSPEAFEAAGRAG
jgi:putative transposase